jgi:dTDP-4-dehydrorhamnose reductase
MRVVVTGAGGFVGRAMVKRFRATGLTHADLDIRNASDVRRAMNRLKPELIINCAVFGVDESEEDPGAAQEVNVDGPGNLAEAAEKNGAAILHFSTNYVFDGRERHTYAVEDAPNPVNVYGRTKLIGECAVFFRSTRAFVVRTSWVFGDGKNSFVSTVHKRLRARERVSAVSDIWASVTYLEDLAGGVAHVVERGRFGLYHVVNEGTCSNEMFAREAAQLTRADESLVDATPSREVHKVRRPRYTPMRSSIPLRNWREALAAYIASTS